VGDYHVSPTWAYTIGFHSSLRAPEIVSGAAVNA